jgi:hypothetical protein
MLSRLSATGESSLGYTRSILFRAQADHLRDYRDRVEPFPCAHVSSAPEQCEGFGGEDVHGQRVPTLRSTGIGNIFLQDVILVQLLLLPLLPLVQAIA